MNHNLEFVRSKKSVQVMDPNNNSGEIFFSGTQCDAETVESNYNALLALNWTANYANEPHSTNNTGLTDWSMGGEGASMISDGTFQIGVPVHAQILTRSY